MPFYAGKDAWFIVGGVRYPMKEWSLTIENSRIDVTNFESVGDFREFLSGFKDGTVTAKGPFKTELARLTPGGSAAFTLGVGGAVSFTIDNCVIVNLKYGTNVEGAAEVEVTAKTNGSFVVT